MFKHAFLRQKVLSVFIMGEKRNGAHDDKQVLEREEHDNAYSSL
jgi:hypothetical protein